MRKVFICILATVISVAGLSAQETEKKQYLPEKGDWALGFDVKPMLQFVENVFNECGDVIESPVVGGEPSLLYGPTVSLMTKYMITDNLALKANLGVLVANDKVAGYVTDDAAMILDPFSESKVTDIMNSRKTGLSLMTGVEYRLGKKRVQGIFGGGLLFGLQKEQIIYTYGNKMTSVNQVPSVATQLGEVYDSKLYRPLKSFAYSPNYFAAAVATAGVEAFIAPKVALGAEVSLCAAYTITQQTYVISEGYNPSSEIIEQRTDLIAPMVGAFNIATENLGGSLYLMFYF